MFPKKDRRSGRIFFWCLWAAVAAPLVVVPIWYGSKVNRQNEAKYRSDKSLEEVQRKYEEASKIGRQ